MSSTSEPETDGAPSRIPVGAPRMSAAAAALTAAFVLRAKTPAITAPWRQISSVPGRPARPADRPRSVLKRRASSPIAGAGPAGARPPTSSVYSNSSAPSARPLNRRLRCSAWPSAKDWTSDGLPRPRRRGRAVRIRSCRSAPWWLLMKASEGFGGRCSSCSRIPSFSLGRRGSPQKTPGPRTKPAGRSVRRSVDSKASVAACDIRRSPVRRGAVRPPRRRARGAPRRPRPRP